VVDGALLNFLEMVSRLEYMLLALSRVDAAGRQNLLHLITGMQKEWKILVCPPGSRGCFLKANFSSFKVVFLITIMYRHSQSEIMATI